MLDALHQVAPSAVIFTIAAGFEQAGSGSQSKGDEIALPPLLSSLFDPKYASCSKKELELILKEKWTEMSFTQEEAEFLQRSTRSQSSCSLWYDYRVGRITSSVFGHVAKCAEHKYPLSLVKSIMQYTTPSSSIPSLKWGRVNEDKARQEYSSSMKLQHTNFSIVSSGLCLNPQYTYLGTSPDGFVSCTVHVVDLIFLK